MNPAGTPPAQFVEEGRNVSHRRKNRSVRLGEISAAVFHLYGIVRDDVDYIMDTFPIVRRKDEAAHGEYRTGSDSQIPPRHSGASSS